MGDSRDSDDFCDVCGEAIGDSVNVFIDGIGVFDGDRGGVRHCAPDDDSYVFLVHRDCVTMLVAGIEASIPVLRAEAEGK